MDVNCFDGISDELKTKAHAVCMYKGKMLLVNHPEWDIWSIPGGTREIGESIEQALKREVLEETNCEVLDYCPISYQKVVDDKGRVCHYRLQYLCNVVRVGDFEDHIENKEFKKLIIRRALELL
jgi:ADP-ribose pyrophosphatase YjhB (NUDIX family)